MKFAIVFLMFFTFKPFANAYSEVELLGQWQYVGYFYQDHRYENINPNLHVYFEFYTDATMKLYWVRDEDNSHCTRTATFKVEDENQLIQHITWVDPENTYECAQDPDMQLGQTTTTPFQIVGDELQLILQLNGQDFIYILKKSTVESN